MPTFFEPNLGQVAGPSDFIARSGQGSALLSSRGASWNKRSMILNGARSVGATGLERQTGVANYYGRGADHAGIPTFARVRYQDVYPGIDIEYYHAGAALEFDFIVHPGADPKQIALHFPGETPRVETSGDLTVATGFILKAPRIHEQGGREVRGQFRVDAGEGVKFEFEDYDLQRTLVIDPIVAVSSPKEWAVATLLIDAADNRFVIGNITVRIKGDESIQAVLAAKFRVDGTLAYTTTIGGSDFSDFGAAGAFDQVGNLYLTGLAQSSNFPGVRPGLSKQNAFLAKLSPTGELQFSVAPLNPANGQAVAVAPGGDVFVTGSLGPGLQAQSGVFQPTYGGGNFDAFVARFGPNGESKWLSFLGSTGDEAARDLKIDKNGDLVILGWISKSPMVLLNPLQIESRLQQAFLAKVSPDGKQLKFALRLPFSIGAKLQLALDGAGNFYLGGTVDSATLPIHERAIQPKFGGASDAAIIALSSDATKLLYATYFGGVHAESLTGMVSDSAGNLTFVGEVAAPTFADATGSPELRYDIPVSPGVEQFGTPGAFIAQLDPSGRLIYSTGSAGLPGLNFAVGPAVDSLGRAFIVSSGRRGPPIEGQPFLAFIDVAVYRSFLVRFDPPSKISLRMISGDRQSGPIGTLTTRPMTVQVVDGNNYPKRGVVIVFRGNRATSPRVSALSDASGLASASVLIDTGPGDITFEANAEGALTPVVFTHVAETPFVLRSYSSTTGQPVAPMRYKISTVAGLPGQQLATGESPASNVSALSARLKSPEAVLVDSSGNLLIGDTASDTVRRVGADGMIQTIATLKRPASLALDKTGLVLAGDDFNIWSIPPSGPPIALLPPYVGIFSGRILARAVYGIGWDLHGLLTWVQSTSAVYFRAPVESPVIVAGDGAWGYIGDGGLAPYARFAFPRGLVFDKAGNLYFCDAGNNRIRKIDTNGIITTVAGDGVAGFRGDGGLAVHARVNSPLGLAIDAAGNLFIGDAGNVRVRLITPSGFIYSIAGSVPGFGGDGGPALEGKLNPFALHVTARGDIYVADTVNQVIRKLTPDAAASSERMLLLNAASFQTGNLAPDELVVLSNGSGGASSTVKLRDGAGRDFEIPTFSQDGRILFRVPSEVSLGSALLGPITVAIDRASPGIFTAAGDGTGPPEGFFVLRDENGNDTYRPVSACLSGSACTPKPVNLSDPKTTAFLVMQGTGLRNAGEGKVEALVAGLAAEVVSITPSDLQPGREMIVLKLPRQIAGTGLVDVQVLAGGLPSNPVWIATTSERITPPPFSWDFSRDTEGWTPVNFESQRVEAGLWWLDPVDDPYLIGPRIAADPKIFKYVKARMSVGCEGRAKVYFRTAADDAYSESKSSVFDAKSCPLCATPAPFFTYTIDMSKHPLWAGTITEIRLDPCDRGVAKTDKDIVLVDSIRLSATP